MKVRPKTVEPRFAPVGSRPLLNVAKAVQVLKQAWAPTSTRKSAPVLSPAERDLRNDATLYGLGDRALPATTPLAAVSAVPPSKGPSMGTAVFVNGVGCSGAKGRENLQEIADATGYSTVGLYNATGGVVRDVAEVTGQKLDLAVTGPAKALAAMISTELDAGRPFKLFAHSQGTVIAAQAIGLLREQLAKKGLAEPQISEKLALVSVETFAPATAAFPDGPMYVHHVNGSDPIAALFGPGKTPTRQLVHHFTSDHLIGSHKLSRYLEERKKWFEQNDAGLV